MIRCKLLVFNGSSTGEWVNASLTIDYLNFFREATAFEKQQQVDNEGKEGKAIVMIGGIQYAVNKDYDEIENEIKNARMGIGDHD